MQSKYYYDVSSCKYFSYSVPSRKFSYLTTNLSPSIHRSPYRNKALPQLVRSAGQTLHARSTGCSFWLTKRKEVQGRKRHWLQFPRGNLFESFSSIEGTRGQARKRCLGQHRGKRAESIKARHIVIYWKHCGHSHLCARAPNKCMSITSSYARVYIIRQRVGI